VDKINDAIRMQKVKEKYAQKFGEKGKLRNRLEEQTQM
jgi:hypothetical protein